MPSRKKTPPAKRAGSEAPAASSGQRSPAHTITHTSRILRKIGEQPKHAGRKQFDEALAEYRAHWQTLPLPTRRAAEQDVAGIHDMTPDLIKAAVKHLEG